MILVTGGTGFLGRNLLENLLAAQYPIRVISRHPDDYSWLAKLPVEIIRADVEDGEAMKRAAEGVDYIIHAAGLFRFWGKSQDFQETNILGTRNILEAALHAGVKKIVHVSTIAVVGFPRDPRIIIDETCPYDPVDDYQRSKVAGEQLVLDYYTQHQVPVVVIRGGAFYGPYGRYGFNQVFLEDPLFNHLPLGVNGGRHLMFPAYIKDVAQGIRLGMEHGRGGEIYNIASQVMTHKEINYAIAAIAGTSPFRLYAPGILMVILARMLTWVSELAGREMHYVMNMAPYTFGEWNVSIEKAQRELGFEPTPFAEGIRQTLEWYQEIGLWRWKNRR